MLSGSIVLIIASLSIHTEMLKAHGRMIFLYSLLAIIGCLSLLMFSDIIKDKISLGKSLLKYIGEHTLIIMTFHFLSFKIVSLVIILFEQLPINMLGAFPVISYLNPNKWWVVYSIVGIGCPLVICKLYECISAIVNTHENHW